MTRQKPLIRQLCDYMICLTIQGKLDKKVKVEKSGKRKAWLSYQRRHSVTAKQFVTDFQRKAVHYRSL